MRSAGSGPSQTRRPLRRSVLLTAALALAVGLVVPTGTRAAADAPATGLTLRSLSVRADLIAGGSDLLAVTLPSGVSPAGASLELDGAPLSDVLHALPAGSLFPAPTVPTWLWQLHDLQPGAHTVSVLAGKARAQLQVTDHPWGSPLFSGPQVQPWSCTTLQAGLGAAQDSYCNAPAQTSYWYMPAGLTGVDTPDTGAVFPAGQFKPYDPAAPPLAGTIASVTTDGGQTVPYVVRYERGTVNRGMYDEAVLAMPGTTYLPWSPPPGWDHKVTYMFGGGCGLNYSQGDYSQNTGAATTVPALDDWSLSRGRAVLFSTMSTTGENCQTVTGAETIMELKQHLTDEYGPIRFTTSLGCSGGSIMPTQVADSYPGLIDGLLPHCSYSDLFNPLLFGVMDCSLIEHYLNSPAGTSFSTAQRAAVEGEVVGDANCAAEESGTAFPSFGTSGTCAGTNSYSATNPSGVQCDLFTRFANELGRNADGTVRRPADNVGVQYGLQALQHGVITADQFVALNAGVGGLDANGGYQSQRTVGDPIAIQRMYRNDLITYGAQLGQVPDIDARSNWQLDMHDNSQWMFTRNRLLRSNGTADNQVHWLETATNAIGMPSGPVESQTQDLLDQWLDTMTADPRSFASSGAKATADKPSAAHDTCFISGQSFAWTPGSVCDQNFSYAGDARMAAGGPDTNDVIKCRLKPLTPSDYQVAFTDAQWAQLQQAFPSGVCDFTQPGLGEQPPTAPWLSYQGGPDGVPLGAPPLAVVSNS